MISDSESDLGLAQHNQGRAVEMQEMYNQAQQQQGQQQPGGVQQQQQGQQLGGSSSSSNTMQVHTVKLWDLQLDRQLTMLREGDLGSLGFSLQSQPKEQH